MHEVLLKFMCRCWCM